MENKIQVQEETTETKKRYNKKPTHDLQPSRKTAMTKDVRQMFEAASPGAVRLLIETMNNPKIHPRLRLECATHVLDRHLGKPKQQNDVDIMGAINIVIGLDEDMTTIKDKKPQIPSRSIHRETDSDKVGEDE